MRFNYVVRIGELSIISSRKRFIVHHIFTLTLKWRYYISKGVPTDYMESYAIQAYEYLNWNSGQSI